MPSHLLLFLRHPCSSAGAGLADMELIQENPLSHSLGAQLPVGSRAAFKCGAGFVPDLCMFMDDEGTQWCHGCEYIISHYQTKCSFWNSLWLMFTRILCSIILFLSCFVPALPNCTCSVSAWFFLIWHWCPMCRWGVCPFISALLVFPCAAPLAWILVLILQ